MQYVTEKMGGAEGTKLDLDFMEMERVIMHFFLFISVVKANTGGWWLAVVVGGRVTLQLTRPDSNRALV